MINPLLSRRHILMPHFRFSFFLPLGLLPRTIQGITSFFMCSIMPVMLVTNSIALSSFSTMHLFIVLTEFFRNAFTYFFAFLTTFFSSFLSSSQPSRSAYRCCSFALQHQSSRHNWMILFGVTILHFLMLWLLICLIH